jgi:uncharacterized membrane protein YhaH (DUF805 family)
MQCLDNNRRVNFTDVWKPDGRYNRRQFALFYFVPPVITLIPLIPVIIFPSLTPLIVITLLLSLFCEYLMIVACIRRLHDLSKSGWYYLFSLIPLGGIILLLYLLFTPGVAESTTPNSNL